MRNSFIVARRELGGYFATPVAAVFIVIFLALQGALTFNLGNFFERNQADLAPFFNFIPWVFLLLVPAITMRLWAEERRLGTIELLLTLPITQGQAVVGKFLAAWAFCAIALALTFPFVITVNYLGAPDNGVIASGYLGALLVAGAFLSVGSALSATTKNQVPSPAEISSHVADAGAAGSDATSDSSTCPRRSPFAKHSRNPNPSPTTRASKAGSPAIAQVSRNRLCGSLISSLDHASLC